jgi:predicted transcriptional regulator
MPQSERSKILMELLKWLASRDDEATTAAIHAQVRNEITQLGATAKTIENYIHDLDHAGFIEYKHPFWRIIKSGRDWLDRHSI